MNFQRLRDFLQNSIITVILLYLLIIVLILIFASSILGGMDQNTIGENPSQLILLIAIPLLILVALGYSFIYVWKKVKTKHSRYRFRLRLVLFIFLIIVLISLPQTILSVSFVDMVFSRWFGPDVGDALNSGLEIALEYYFDLNRELEDIGNSPYLALSVSKVIHSPDQVWKEVKVQYPRIEGMQIVSPDELYVFGDPRLTYSRNEIAQLQSGLIPKRTVPEFSILGFIKEYQIGGEPYQIVLYRTIPRKFDEHARNLTQVIEKFKQFNEYEGIFRIGLILFYAIFLVPVLFLGLVVALYVSQRLIQPFLGLEEATRRVAQGDYSYRLLSREKDDFSFLTDSFNSMVQELEVSRKETLQTEKVSAWQDIAQRLAHEIRNPLTPIRLYAQRVLARLGDDEMPEEVIRKGMDRILVEVDNLNNLLTEFREFARQKPPALEEVNLKKFIYTIIEVLEESSPRVSFITDDFPTDLLIQVDQGQLRQVFNNLISNSIQAMDGDGVIILRADLVKKGYSVYCRVQVSDSGPGIPEEMLGQVFKPYYTTREEGTGLGLSIVERIIHDHRGRIWVESAQGEGTTFYLDLPYEELYGKDSDY
ncbi:MULTISPECIES: PAS domain-containing sensor histidine kinase [unclassified Oceanispirochaeta]|uniref:sensor histidine kinase n=1 Tax=unclassified Oceanispirochaeta TaxID=2635722 RepID=UPI000E0979CB|nr:ATP-binding protein [Oceanispirochaeta sp. M1]MBF9015352.1 HAMP domain-containing protein [Oceanispirochaeta sp. M2]NPD71810.1 HAMP domain-containing protein [Oceanispirochaeta sp. M1]RDG32999.1 HAMP domain-containing protein [Oceanispirochaeta sp. M1]